MRNERKNFALSIVNQVEVDRSLLSYFCSPAHYFLLFFVCCIEALQVTTSRYLERIYESRLRLLGRILVAPPSPLVFANVIAALGQDR
jgi:hypothetical protein